MKLEGYEEAQDLVVTRVFDAPVERVWNAWSDPDHLMRWWGPTGFTSPTCAMDFREGGTSLVCMRSPDGQHFYNTWAYSTIKPRHLIEFVMDLADEHGRRVDDPTGQGLPPDFPRDVHHVVTLVELADDRTELTVTELGYTSATMLEISAAGLNQCLDKMAASFVEP